MDSTSWGGGLSVLVLWLTRESNCGSSALVASEVQLYGAATSMKSPCSNTVLYGLLTRTACAQHMMLDAVSDDGPSMIISDPPMICHSATHSMMSYIERKLLPAKTSTSSWSTMRIVNRCAYPEWHLCGSHWTLQVGLGHQPVRAFGLLERLTGANV